MNTHLKTTLTILALAAIATGLYYIPVIMATGFVLAFAYSALYVEIQETEKKLEEKEIERKKTKNEQ
jgi:hypothetical protein